MPVTPAECLRLAGTAPILFQRQGGQWWPVAVTDPDACLASPLSRNWRWRGSYVPYMLRVLPFVRRGGANDDGTPVRGLAAWSVEESLLQARDTHGAPFLDGAGQVSTAMGGVLKELKSAERELREMSRSLSLLTRVSLLAPLPIVFRLQGTSASTASLYAVDVEKLQKLETHWLGALASGQPSPLELAIASVFSMRLLGGYFLSRSAADLDVWLGQVMRVVVNRDPKALPKAPEVPAGRVTYALDESAILDFSALR
ncbi:MAG: SapC family protein [Alsobacter sp.]